MTHQHTPIKTTKKAKSPPMAFSFLSSNILNTLNFKQSKDADNTPNPAASNQQSKTLYAQYTKVSRRLTKSLAINLMQHQNQSSD